MLCRLCLGLGAVAVAGIVDVSDRTAFSQQAPAVQLDTIQVEAQRARRSRGPSPASQQASQQTPTAPTERGDGPVQGYVATRSVTGTKTDTPIVETPQSISVITRDQMSDQGAQTVSDALHYTPGVFTNINGATARYDETRIRGFLPILYLDGMPLPLNRFFATPSISTYGLERLEVLRGPSSVLYGQNSPGGLINMVSKRPTEKPFGEIQLSGGSFNTWEGAFDIGGPGNAEKTFLYRLTGQIRDSDTMVDFSKDKRSFIAPSFTWRNLDTSLTVLAHYGKDEGTFPQQYLPAQGTLFFNPNGQIPRNRFVGEPGWDNFTREQWAAGYAFEHRFNDTWQFRQNLRYMEVDSYFQAFRSEGLQADLVTLDRGAYSQATDARTFTIDNQFQADFITGALRHKALFGLDYMNTSGNWDFKFAFPPKWGGIVPPINVFNPGYGAAVPALAPRNNNHDTLKQLGVYAQDQIKLDRWILTLGGRHDWSEVSTLDRLANTFVQESNQAFSGRAGLGYAFDNGVVPYVAVATSFQQEVGVDVNGDPFKPTKGLQYEAGIKYQPVGTKALYTVAIFDLTRRNVVTTNPSFEATQTGEVNVRGLELEAKAELTDRLDLIANYSYMDSEVTKSTNPLELGRPAPMTPRHSASGWLNYTLLPGLRVGGGVRYVGENYSQTNDTDQFLVPSYVVYDAAVK